MNSSPDHSVKCTGTVKITVPEGYTGDYGSAFELPSDNRFSTEVGVGFGFENPVFASDDPTDELGTAQQKAHITDYLQKRIPTAASAAMTVFIINMRITTAISPLS